MPYVVRRHCTWIHFVSSNITAEHYVEIDQPEQGERIYVGGAWRPREGTPPDHISGGGAPGPLFDPDDITLVRQMIYQPTSNDPIQRAADAAEMAYHQNTPGNVWTWRRVVLTIAKELREPTDEMCDAGNASTASWLDLDRRGLHGIEAQREKYRLRWRAMMDRLIGDGIPETMYERAQLRPSN